MAARTDPSRRSRPLAGWTLSCGRRAQTRGVRSRLVAGHRGRPCRSMIGASNPPPALIPGFPPCMGKTCWLRLVFHLKSKLVHGRAARTLGRADQASDPTRCRSNNTNTQNGRFSQRIAMRRRRGFTRVPYSIPLRYPGFIFPMAMRANGGGNGGPVLYYSGILGGGKFFTASNKYKLKAVAHSLLVQRYGLILDIPRCHC
jgi:hypothetical protein